VSDAEPIPFFDADGEHDITVPIEYDDTGEPPQVAELIGPDQDGKIMHVFYQRTPAPGESPPWAYRETSRTPPAAAPPAGSAEALLRLLGSQEWPDLTAH
jgi:hypothetical protein